MAKKNGGQAGPNRAWLEEAIATKGALTLDEVHYVTGVLAKPDYEDADLASLVIRIRTAQQRRAEGSASSQVVPTSTSPAPEPRARAADATPPSERTPSCPKCGGRMWDNRLSKRNPKAPDFKCRDRSCDGVIWPPRPAEERRDEPPAYAGDPGPDDLPPALDSSPLGMAIDDIPF